MRLTRLDLLCYGAFENRSIVLRPDAKLHVLFGANEAGKSTTLSAVRDLLFGFPMRTPHDFRHKTTDLRVGGELMSRAGACLSVIRRKGTKNTLLDASGTPLAEDALVPFLGQVSREIFSSAFGLDAECLRKGAEDLLQARGEVRIGRGQHACRFIDCSRLPRTRQAHRRGGAGGERRPPAKVVAARSVRDGEERNA